MIFSRVRSILNQWPLGFSLLILLTSCIPTPKPTDKTSKGAISGPNSIVVLSPETVSTPSVKINGNFLIGQLVTLHINSSCTQAVGSQIADNNAYVIIRSSPLPVDQKVNFYASITSKTGAVSGCSSISAEFTYSSGVKPPVATLSILNSSNPAPKIIVSNIIPGASIEVYRDPACSILVATVLNVPSNLVEVSSSALIDGNGFFMDGPFQFFVKQTSIGITSVCSAPSPVYTLNTKPPLISMVTPIIAKERRPVVRVSGIQIGAEVKIYTSPICDLPSLVGQQVSSSTSTDIVLGQDLPFDGPYSFYATQKFNNGLSQCSQVFASYTLDTRPGPLSVVTNSPNFISNPVININNLIAGKDLEVFTTANCSGTPVLSVLNPPSTSYTGAINNLGLDGVYTFYARQKLDSNPLRYTPCSGSGPSYTLNTAGKNISISSPIVGTSVSGTSTIPKVKIKNINPSTVLIHLYESTNCNGTSLNALLAPFSMVPVTNEIEIPINLATHIQTNLTNGNVASRIYNFSYKEQDNLGNIGACSGPSSTAVYNYDIVAHFSKFITPSPSSEVFPTMELQNLIIGSNVKLYQGTGCIGPAVGEIVSVTQGIQNITPTNAVVGGLSIIPATEGNNLYSLKQIVAGSNSPCSPDVITYERKSQIPAPIMITASPGSNPFPTVKLTNLLSNHKVEVFHGTSCSNGNSLGVFDIPNGVNEITVGLTGTFPSDGIFNISTRLKYVINPGPTLIDGTCSTNNPIYDLRTMLTSITPYGAQTDGGNDSTPSFQVTGAIIGSLITLHSEPGCLNTSILGSKFANNSVEIITANPLNVEGIHTFFAKQSISVGGNTFNSPCSQTSSSYNLNTRPTAISLITIPTEIDLTPVFKVEGVQVGSTVSIFSDPFCSIILGSAVSQGTEAIVEVNPSNALNENKQYKFYANQSLNGLSSGCSTAFATYTLNTVVGPLQLDTGHNPIDNKINPKIVIKNVRPGATALLYKDAQCSLLIGSSNTQSGPNQVTVTVNAINALPADGTYIFYAKQSFEGHVSACSSTANFLLSYTLNTQMTFSASLSAVNIFRPIFTLNSTIPGYTLALYSDSICNTKISDDLSVTLTSSSVAINSANEFKDEGTFNIYAKQWNGSFNSPCTSVPKSYVLNYTPLVTLISASKLPTQFVNLKVERVVSNGQISIYKDSLCTQAVTGGQNLAVPLNATEITPTVDVTVSGNYQFFAKQRHPNDITKFSACSAASLSFLYDSTPEIVLTGSTSVTLLRPTITVKNIKVSGANTVNLYLDSSCTGTIYGSVSNPLISQVSIPFTVDLPSLGSFTVYAKQTDISPSGSACSSGNSFNLDLGVLPTLSSSSPGNTTPQVSVASSISGGSFKVGDTIILYKDSACTGPIIGSQLLASAVSPAIVTVNGGNLSPAEGVSIFARRISGALIGPCSLTSSSYEVDFSPSVFSLDPSTPGPSNRFLRPKIKITGLITGSSLNLYSNNTCTALVGQGVESGGQVIIEATKITVDQTLVNYYAKQVTASGKTSICSVNSISYRLDLKPKNIVLVSPASTPSSITAPTIQIGLNSAASNLNNGSSVDLYSDATCTNHIANGVIPLFGNAYINLITNPLLQDANYSLSAKQNSEGVVSSCSGALATYNLQSHPTSLRMLSFSDLSASPTEYSNKRLSPRILVDGVKSGALVNLYLNDPTCNENNKRGSTVATSTTAFIRVLPGIIPVEGSIYSFYAKKIDNGGQGTISGCSSVGNFKADYKYSATATSWETIENIKYSSPENFAFFGNALFISKKVMAVGAPSANGGKGKVTFYEFNGFGWIKKFDVDYPTSPALDSFAGFGTSLHFYLDGTNETLTANARLIIGAPSQSSYGRAYIYKHNGTTFVLEQILSDASGVSGDDFGAKVKISPNYALVSSPERDNSRGEIFHFGFINTSFSITPTRISAPDGNPNHYFGSALDIDGTKIIVGAPGNERAYIFDQATSLVTPIKILQNPAGVFSGEDFGFKVGLKNNIAIVTMPGYSNDKGAVVIFSGSSFANNLTKTPAEGINGDRFGEGLSFDGTTILSGAPGVLSGKGAAYFLTGTNWAIAQKASDIIGAAANDNFGSAVSIDGNMGVIASPNQGTSSGQLTAITNN